VFDCDELEDLLFAKDEDLDYSLDDCWNDPEADSMIHSVDNMPSGGAVTGSENITGAFDTYGYFETPVFNVTDQYNAVEDATVTIVVGVVLPPITMWLEMESNWERENIFAANESFFRQAVGQ